MTAAKNQQHHEAGLFTRILTRMARLTESVEGLNEEMDELRKLLDGSNEGPPGRWMEAQKEVQSIHSGAVIHRERVGGDEDPTWSVLEFHNGPRIAGSESTSWKMAWVYAAETLKGNLYNAKKSTGDLPPGSTPKPAWYIAFDTIRGVYPKAVAYMETDSHGGPKWSVVEFAGGPKIAGTESGSMEASLILAADAVNRLSSEPAGEVKKPTGV